MPSPHSLRDLVGRWCPLLTVVVPVAVAVRVLSGVPPVPVPVVVSSAVVLLLTVATGGLIGVGLERHLVDDPSDPSTGRRTRLGIVVAAILGMVVSLLVYLRAADWLLRATGVAGG